MKKVAAFVYNNCKNDARVLKEAKTLVDNGYDVTIYALQDKTVPNEEIRDGIKLVRLPKNPIHYRLFRVLRALKNIVVSILLAVYDGIDSIHKILTKQPELSKLQEFKESAKNTFSQKGASAGVKYSLSNAPFFLIITAIILAVLFSPVLVAMVFVLAFYYIVYTGVRGFLMIFHRPLCLYDFYERAVKEVGKNNYDYLHGHDLYTLPIVTKASREFGGKAVYDSHELFTEISAFTPFERRMYTRLEAKLFPKVQASITVNKTIAEELSKRYNVAEPTVIMNCPPKLEVEEGNKRNLLLEKVGIENDDRKIVLYQGGYGPSRGLQNLVLSNKYLENTLMIFMGWGSLEDELRSLAEQEGLMNKKIIFTGPAKQTELLHYTKCADVGIIPYQFVGLNNYYCSPNKLFEYINAHIAIAASDFPELKRVIKGCKVGATFDPESPKDIARSIREIIENDDTLNEMKQNTYAAAEHYNWEKESQKLVELYKNL